MEYERYLEKGHTQIYILMADLEKIKGLAGGPMV